MKAPDKSKLAPGENFVKLTRNCLESGGWNDIGINGFRLMRFLWIEHCRHGGTANGYLVAPRDQLIAFGIGTRYVTDAIEQVERSGLVAVKQGKGRRPTTFTLTWLALGRPPKSNRRGIPRDTAKGIPRDTATL